MSFIRIKGRWPAIRHHSFVRSFSGLAPYYIVNEFPKSGGTWLALMLSDALEIPFRRNEPIRLERSVTHGHFLKPFGLRNTVVLWRDPRDLLVSYYYHCYFVNEHHNAKLVQLMKVRCPFDSYADISSNLPTFIQFLTETPLSPSFSWPDFAQIWINRPGSLQTSYEALRADTPGELGRVVEMLTGRCLSDAQASEVAERHSFVRAKKEAERSWQESAQAEISFVREGALGGWRKHFTPEAEAALHKGGYFKFMKQLQYS